MSKGISTFVVSQQN